MIPLPEPVNFSDVQLPGNNEFNQKFAVWGYTADQLRAMHRQGWDAAMAAVGAEVERLQVQLAGCGVAAMSNTRESLARAREVTPDSYGWSASYGDCIAAAMLSEPRLQLMSLPILSYERSALYVVGVFTCKISEHKLDMLIRPAIGFASFTVSS